jgi:hypothetical protein
MPLVAVRASLQLVGVPAITEADVKNKATKGDLSKGDDCAIRDDVDNGRSKSGRGSSK